MAGAISAPPRASASVAIRSAMLRCRRTELSAATGAPAVAWLTPRSTAAQPGRSETGCSCSGSPTAISLPPIFETTPAIRAHCPAPTMPASSMMNTNRPRLGASPRDQRASQAASDAVRMPLMPPSSCVALPEAAPPRTSNPRACQTRATSPSVKVLPVPA